MGVGVIKIGKAPPLSLRLSVNFSAIAFKVARASEGSATASGLAVKLHRCTLVSFMRDLRSLLNFRIS